MGRYRVKYKLYDAIHGNWAYTIHDSIENKLLDVNPTKLVESGLYKLLDNVKLLDNNTLEIIDAIDVHCGNNHYTVSGRLIPGFNDFETYCLKNNMYYLIEEYDTEKNAKSINGISAKAIDRVWWKCKTCGNEWQAIIKTRTSGAKTKCPMCQYKAGKYNLTVTGSNDLETWCKKNNRLDILEEYAQDNPIKASEISYGNSKINIKFVCKHCGKPYQALVANRLKSNGCPYCRPSGVSFPELVIYNAMSDIFDEVNYKAKVFKQQPKMELDVYIRDINLGIEYDGALWHSSDEAKYREKIKNNLCIENEINLLRVKEVSGTNKPIIYDNYIQCGLSKEDLRDLLLAICTWINKRFNTNISLSSYNMINAINTAKIRLNNREVQNSLADTHPDIASRWDYEKNGNFKPTMITSGTKYKAWFKCDKCNHSYYSFIRKQASGQRCPICAGQKIIPGYNDFATAFPYVMPFWNYTKNSEIGIFPDKRSIQSSIKAYWKCPKCGVESYYPMWAFTNKLRCMNCGLKIHP